MINRLRTLLFYLALIIFTVPYSTFCLFTCVIPFKPRYYIITFYSRFVIFLVRIICGVRYDVIGLDNLPKKNCIIMSNHQSTWEALAFQAIFPLQTWVIKKQLLCIPFFGWAFALLKPIAIDRNKKTASMEQLLQQGRQQLKAGRWLVVFPEGTRTAPGEHKKFSKGGAVLAEKTHTSVIPVAHNAGKFWGKHAFIITPGTIKVIVGTPIHTDTLTAHDINEQAQTWIWKTLEELLK